jgi:hypothetical protein
MNENPQRAKRALQALRAADQQGMGRVAGGMGAEATDRLADLEACMHAYRTWSPSLIPGLLQTSMYSAGAIKSRTPSLDASEITLRVSHRRARSEAFLARMAGRTARDGMAWFLIGEVAITRPLLNDHAHADQLRHLLSVSQDYGNITIQVLPETAPTPGTVEPFDVYNLDPGPVVGHLESLIGGWYTIASEDIARLRGTFSEMIGYAMSTADSRVYISEVLEECWGHTAEPSSSSPRTATRTTASTSLVLPPAPSE